MNNTKKKCDACGAEMSAHTGGYWTLRDQYMESVNELCPECAAMVMPALRTALAEDAAK